ncbi:MAG: hypothetical protein L0Z62_42535 [Gemmataceae bacterium]|nr:hypothetical protein [Gemmataceae bacterium]
MTDSEVKPARSDWILSNPWPWIFTALLASAVALIWVRLGGDALAGVRFALIGVGLFGAATAVCLQLRGPGERLGRYGRRRAALLVIGANALAALAAGVLLVLSLRGGEDLDWPTGGEWFFWLLLALWSGLAAVYLLREAVRAGAESAAVLTLAAAVAYLTCWALFLGADRAGEWDSIRLFLGVLALVTFAAAPLAAASSRVRRLAVSALIVFHFGGIVTAAASQAPGPWVFNQLWLRLYRPYLEFMYLNNAYRFYSPEPGPSHQMWFRVEYHDKAAGKMRSHWFQLPELDSDGRPLYPVALQYQRRLMLADAATRALPTPATEYRDLTGVQEPPFARRRREQTPEGFAAIKDKLGKEQPRSGLIVPHLRHLVAPQDPRLRNVEYSPPDANSKVLLQSYARHATRLRHPDHPSAVPVRVKVYRVVHWIVSPQELAQGLHPQDMTNLLFYYQGEYDPKGHLQDPEDPFLYWLLPVVRRNWWDPNSPILVYAYLHAGDGQYAVRAPYRDGHKVIPQGE